MSTSVGAASDDCAVLDLMLRQARTEFPTLRTKGFGGARCKYRTKEFKCEWPFSTDRYGEAETQIDRLERCTAAQHDAKLLEKKKHQAVFQIDPDTKVLIRGPDPYEGLWTIELKVTTTADWD
jgi:hypothetical protein